MCKLNVLKINLQVKALFFISSATLDLPIPDVLYIESFLVIRPIPIIFDSIFKPLFSALLFISLRNMWVCMKSLMHIIPFLYFNKYKTNATLNFPLLFSSS